MAAHVGGRRGPSPSPAGSRFVVGGSSGGPAWLGLGRPSDTSSGGGADSATQRRGGGDAELGVVGRGT
jgi:hypothetical protein